MSSSRESSTSRYALAVVAVAGALAAHHALRSFGVVPPYVPFYMAAALVAAIGGTGPGLLAIAASLMAVTRLVPDPPSTAEGSGWPIATSWFLVASAVTLVTIELARAARARQAARRDAERHARTVVEAANRAKHELLAMLGHELRNPLSAVRNAITVARLDGARRDEALDIAGRQSEQLARLVEELLDVARVTRGRIVLRRERVRLDAVVAGAIDGVHDLVEHRRHSLAVRLPDGAVEVEGDFVRLVQIVTNLLSNAAKYTPPGGHIDVCAGRRDGMVEIRVHDDGAGIPHELAPRIFDLFAQGERPLDRALGGLGIGLTVVKRIAELHGGSVHMRSDGRDRGSEFVVALPALAAVDPPRDAGPAVAAASRPARVLVVESNVEVADACVLQLHELGHEVQVAHDGLAALGVTRKRAPDVALIDMGLPGMDGCELARRMRHCRGAEQSILVALTADGREEDHRRAATAGFDRELAKPVELDAMRELLRSLPAR